jgi:hypothetical protein
VVVADHAETGGTIGAAAPAVECSRFPVDLVLWRSNDDTAVDELKAGVAADAVAVRLTAAVCGLAGRVDAADAVALISQCEVHSEARAEEERLRGSRRSVGGPAETTTTIALHSCEWCASDGAALLCPQQQHATPS